MRKLLRFVVAALAIAALAAPLASAPACFPQGACDESPASFYCRLGENNCPGRVIGTTTWESNPLTGKWLLFPKQSTLEVDPRGPDGARIKGNVVSTLTWISACETPNTAGCNYALASGNNSVWFATSYGTFYIKNDTCQDFYVRALFESDGIETPDGGAVDASSQDGTTDGAVE